jgi:hypothetical protein
VSQNEEIPSGGISTPPVIYGREIDLLNVPTHVDHKSIDLTCFACESEWSVRRRNASWPRREKVLSHTICDIVNRTPQRRNICWMAALLIGPSMRRPGSVKRSLILLALFRSRASEEQDIAVRIGNFKAAQTVVRVL